MLTRTAREIHCHICGGFIGDPGTMAYRVADGSAVAAPHSGMCACRPPTVYGAPPTPEIA